MGESDCMSVHVVSLGLENWPDGIAWHRQPVTSLMWHPVLRLAVAGGNGWPRSFWRAYPSEPDFTCQCRTDSGPGRRGWVLARPAVVRKRQAWSVPQSDGESEIMAWWKRGPVGVRHSFAGSGPRSRIFRLDLRRPDNKVLIMHVQYLSVPPIPAARQS